MTRQTESVRRNIRTNIGREPWVRATVKEAVDSTRWWMERSDGELWGLMFTPGIHRAWMVWSEGYCPSCRQGVPMYNWKYDALTRPWKMWCPHCGETFPKNDFGTFHASGLDEHSLFDAARADRSLLFNAEHPDPTDPLHGFGVDAGDGWVADGHCWRFVGAYLVYGHWKTLIVEGIRRLSCAYVLTGEPVYARKTAVLLDRVADLYPDFDHVVQASMYRDVHTNGFVSTWHDACEETREMAEAWERVRGAALEDSSLVAFLCEKSSRFGTAIRKQSADDIRHNIETRIFREAVIQKHKIHSNYPRRDICLATMHHLLNGPGDAETGDRIVDDMIRGATAIDGVTGEKGLAGYTAFVIQGLAVYLARREQQEPGFLARMIARHSKLALTWRFHIDTWCMEQYYPAVGDTMWFGARSEQYVGMSFPGPMPLGPSMFTFLWQLYETTHDPAYAQVLYIANGRKLDDLPKDPGHPDPAGFRKAVESLVNREGPIPNLRSVDKKEWHLAIMRSGKGANRRALWLNYDTGGGHSHMNGMNAGLFARGLDLIPDFGYPPVQFGGWDTPEAKSYYRTSSHNTVVVDGKDTAHGWTLDSIRAGRTTLWADGRLVRWIRVSAPTLFPDLVLQQFERTLVMVDVSETDFYVVDIFRVVGGGDHARFMHSHYGTVRVDGLNLQPGPDYGHDTLMRNFRTDSSPSIPWTAAWNIEDRYGFLQPGTPVGFRYTDLTRGASASTCEGWINAGIFDACKPGWLPRLMIRRQGTSPLASTFVAVLEPHGKEPVISKCRRLSVRTCGGVDCGDNVVGLEVKLADGRSDILLAADTEDPLHHSPQDTAGGQWIPEVTLGSNAELTWLRVRPDGRIQSAALGNGTGFTYAGQHIAPPTPTPFFELEA